MSTPDDETPISREQLRLLLLHEYRLGSTARAAATKICQTMGPGTVSHVTASRWFNRFKDGNTNLEDEPHSGRPSDFDIAALKDIIEKDPRQTSRCLVEHFKCTHPTILRYLHELGKSWKMGMWIPHTLTADLSRLRSDICISLLTFKRTTAWLENLITGDEKYVLYANYNRGRQWLSRGEIGIPNTKQDLHPKKSLLSCWWNAKGIVHWELLPTNTTVNAELYCAQLDVVASKLRGKQDRVYFQHDNARPHIAKVTQQKLQSLGWAVIPHPPYSPDLAPSDYHLFRSLAHHLEGKEFKNDDDLKTSLQTFFDEKSPEFYKRGIDLLPIRWQYVVDNNGAYVVD